jgi:hypothetical protein
VGRGYYSGFIDFNGNRIVPLIYDSAGGEFESGLASVSKDGKWGYIDTNGRVIIPFMFDDAGPFYGGGNSYRRSFAAGQALLTDPASSCFRFPTQIRRAL